MVRLLSPVRRWGFACFACLGLTALATPSCSAGGTAPGGGTASGAPKTGEERGACYPNKTCNKPLTCVPSSNVCVDLGGGGAGGQSSGGSGGSVSTAGGSNQAGTGAGPTAGSSSGGSPGGCAGKVYIAKQAPAAMLVLLDRSSSMTGTKWQAASAAINGALEQTVFNSMSVGLLSAPAQGDIPGPSCLFNFPVPCQAPPTPQIALQDVNDALRGQIKSWLTSNAPQGGGPLDADASPLYEAAANSLAALKSWPKDGKRILLVISDGTLSCNQFSSRPGFSDCNGCDHDWEHPDNLIKLFGDAHNDPQKPVNTFVVGVPGADTYDPAGCTYPPYHMRAALSAIAYAGAPEYVDPTCNGTQFTPSTTAPTVPCHFDMTQGVFSSQELAANISKIRAKTLGCVFELPVPEGNEMIDKAQINVELNVGQGPTKIPRRSDPGDPCAADYCWDYTADSKVELVGKSCDDLKNAAMAAVSIVAGCDTIIK